MYETLQHAHGGECPNCGARKLVSAWLGEDGLYYFVITCEVCDAPEEVAA